MQFVASVLANVEISPGYWRMRLSAPRQFAAAAPGQFVMVRVAEAIDPLLRRPLAVFDLGESPGATPDSAPQTFFEMLYKVVGKGTAHLSGRRAGDRVDILGPIGRGFDAGPAGEEKLLVGGGIGLAPLYLLARQLSAAPSAERAPVRLFAGGRTRHDLLCLDDFARQGVDCHTATEDGSHGERGYVTVALNRHLDALAGEATIYACGPEPMLHAVAAIAAERRIPCQVSLEALMACGVGACLGCVVPGRDHTGETPDYRCVCAEGPVFASSQLQWGAAR